MKFVTLSLLATALTVGGNAAEQARSSKQPNILFILADDFGWRDLACTGSRYYESPNIDGIARNGVRFTQGYAACQVSSPSRASIMTGKFTARHGITNWIGEGSGIEVLCIQVVLGDTEGFSEALVMDDFASPQEFDGFADIRILDQT